MFGIKRKKHFDLANAYEQVKDGVDHMSLIAKRRKISKFYLFIKLTSILIILSIVFLAGFLVFNFYNFKIAYQSALTGKENLEYALVLVKEKKYETAADFAGIAEKNFNDASGIVNIYRDNFLIGHVPLFAGEINDVGYLLSSLTLISQAVREGAAFGAGFDILLKTEGVTFASLSKNEKRQVLKKIYESTPELNGLKANIDLAVLNLRNVKASGLLWPLKSKISSLNINLIEIEEVLGRVMPLTQLLPPLLGYPEKAEFLVLLQNSDELRPTGGFIGTYGILEFENGDIERFDTHDVYHMDMPVKDKLNIAPPAPLVKYLGVKKWYMRDANWSPDWATAANKIEWFYWQEDRLLPAKDQVNNFKGKFEGVIGITPRFVTDLLSLIGPITVDGEVYNKDNFTKLLEYKVEKEYEVLGVPSWHRKEVIGDIISELKLKITQQPLDKMITVSKLLSDNLDQKNIMLFLHDPYLQEIAGENNWTAEISSDDGDYAMVVDANMASLKTDAVINRNISYSLDQNINGSFAHLYINYAHNGGVDWRTNKYRTYVRVYIPLGSELIKTEGVSDGTVKVESDSGKTVFSCLKVIEPGKIGSLHFYYKLPESVNAGIRAGKYSLYFQKQPGSRVDSLKLDFKFLNNIKNFSPTGFYINKSYNTLNWETDLATDKEIEASFK